MLDLKVKQSQGKPAEDFNTGDLFMDGDGDLCLRCVEGIIRFYEEDIVPYCERELDDYNQFPYLQDCRYVEGTVKFKVKLK